ncbi:PilW family protein [Wohlfahrtiimonas larvae]|uniref:Prepilin-type N-terminal cleavage/methylation domain-containing protein n=1 Tax=Wohlfahrtiimonas larvae TaxID=1157986 RepID=A0ABP9N0P7_9GAMM|nr:hypothetical protein [Wohlfahrtiimonas larvae]
MLKFYKNKGVSLIELMVAVGLSLTLVLSMLAFYSISSKNVIDFQSANHDQQQIRKMMNLLETDIENTGGFECAKPDDIFAFNNTNIFRVPTDIISLGNDITRKQIVFVHPVISEYQHTALGMLDFNKVPQTQLSNYQPLPITDAGCGQDQSLVYIGTTILEMMPMNNIITTNDSYGETANDIDAFVALSAVQARKDGSQNIPVNTYTPSMNDATVMFLSDEKESNQISVGRNKVDIFLGFAPEDANGTIFTYVPELDITSEADFKAGGWINPFFSNDHYNLVTNQSNDNNTPEPNLLSRTLHQASDANGLSMNTYPLKKELINQIRAIKFKFTFGAHNGIPERQLTRVIRFKNTYLMKLNQ